MPMTEKQVDQLINAYLKGTPVVYLVSEFQISSTMIYRILKQEGINPNRMDAFKKRIKKIKEDFLKGMSKVKIMKKHKVGERVYYRAIK